MQTQFPFLVLVGVFLFVVVSPSSSQYTNLHVTVPNGFYPAPPPGQFQYLYTPPNSNSINSNAFNAPITTTRSTPLRRNNKDKNEVVVRLDNQKPRKKSKKVNKTSVMEGVEGGRREGVKYSYIPIELLSALLNNEVNERPVEPLPIVPASNNDLDVQLGSGVFIRVPLRFRNTSRQQQQQQQPQQQTPNNDMEEQDEDEQVEAVYEDEVIPMSMFEEMLEVDMRRRFNTTNPVFNSPEGARVTLNNLLRLFAPPASLLRRAGNQLNNNENLFMRLLKERYQLSNANNIFNRNLNRDQKKN